MFIVTAPPFSPQKVSILDSDPRVELDRERLMPIEDLKEVQITPQGFHTTLFGTSLSKAEEVFMVVLLRRNTDLFTWIHQTCPILILK